MSKYIHKKLDHFLKQDAKKIKLLNPKIKKSEILNILSSMFGWRHYNELEKNLQKNTFSKEIIDISEFNFEKLYSFKFKYYNNIYDIFPIKKEDKYDDPYDISNGLFFKLLNKKKMLFKKEDGTTLNVSLLRNETRIILNNNEIEKLLYKVLDKMTLSDSSGGMWRGRSTIAISSIIKALENDNNDKNFQEELIKFFSFNSLVDYWKNYNGKIKYVDGLSQYIKNMPGFSDEYFETNELQQCSLEQHGYIMMCFYIIKQSFLNANISNTRSYTLDDFRNHKGNVVIEHYDKGDIEIDLKLISELI